MKKLTRFWMSGKQMNLIILSALIYTAVLIPFKNIILVPQIAELRVAAFVPVVLGIVLGPAGAVGCALGNLLADLFGTWTYGSFFGMLGNFFIGYVAFRLWAYRYKKRGYSTLIQKNVLYHFIQFTKVSLLANLAGTLVIALGVEALGYAQFLTTFTAIVVTNMLSALLFGWWMILPTAYFCEDNAFSWNHKEGMLPYKNSLLQEHWHSDPYLMASILSTAGLSVLIAVIRGQKLYEAHFNGEMDLLVVLNATALFMVMFITLISGKFINPVPVNGKRSDTPAAAENSPSTLK